MALIPVDTRLKVEQAMEDGYIKQGFRPYLGASSLGSDCARSLWYGFRLCSTEEITKRQNRLFSRGHKEEPIIVSDLAKVGVLHHSDQKGFVTGHGHIKGHCDGILENVPDAPKTSHLAEFKTANDKNFKGMVKNGLKKSKPIYYDQMVIYMDQLGLKRGLFIMVNKNDDSRYYERVEANPARANELIQRGIDIISTEIPPQKIGGQTWFACKWCRHYQVCHFNAPVHKTCRSCQYCDIEDEGKWSCSKHSIELTFEQQQIACQGYRLLVALVQD